MRPPFPGMDPWLEHPDVWSDVHASLITAIRDTLNPQVVPRYVVRVESRTTVLTGLDVNLVYRPDLAVRSADLPSPVRDARRLRFGAYTGRAIPGGGAHRGGRDRGDVLDHPGIARPQTRHRDRGSLPNEQEDTRRPAGVPRQATQSDPDWGQFCGDRPAALGEPMPVRNAPPRERLPHPRLSTAKRAERSDLYGFSYTTPIPDIPIPLLPGDRSRSFT